jgi:chemotaxis protein methyltransferase CheR
MSERPQLTTSPNGFFSQTLPVMRSSPIPEPLLCELVRLIEQRTLMQFGSERRDLLLNTLGALAGAAGAGDTATYAGKLLGAGHEKELMALVEALTINETTFFRNVPQLNLFAQYALPKVIARKRATSEPKNLKIWSAGCSYGQEAYTLAILAHELVQPLYTWGVQILATDLAKRVLEVGRRAVYPKARLDTMPPAVRTQYFHDLGEQIRVKDQIRQSVTFMQHNLRDPFPADRFDVIFCRNVMIYFSRQDQIRLAQRFHDHLAPEGFLFIGHSESLQGLNVGLQMRLHNGGVAYQKE